MVEPKGKQSNLTASPLTKGLPSSPYSMSHVTSVLSSDEILLHLVAGLGIVEVRVQELLEVRLDGVLVLAQRATEFLAMLRKIASGFFR